MIALKNKIDFAVIFRVSKANPNGDPLNGNRPRIDFAGARRATGFSTDSRRSTQRRAPGRRFLFNQTNVVSMTPRTCACAPKKCSPQRS
jgi:CRISPR-associated protein Cas7